MLLNTNLFFDIEIGKISNFLDIKDLICFNMVETSGVELPTFYLAFRTTNKNIKEKIIENNPIKVKIGTDKTNADNFTISIMTKHVEESSLGYYNCYIHGFLSNKRFLLDKVIRAVTGTSLAGIQQVGAEYMTQVDSDIYTVNEDPQNWIISNHSNQKLITDMWLHMYIYPSFPLIAINRYGRILLRDFNNLKSSKPKYNFVQKKSPDKVNEVIYLNDFRPDNNTHAYNLYAGYGKAVNIVDQTTGNYKVFVNESSPSNLAASQEVEETQSGNRVFDGYSQSDNTHKHFHEAYFYNTAKLLQLSNICGNLEFKGIYKRELSLLDLVNVQPLDSEKNSSLSGRYIVNTIEYNLTASTPFSTRVYVCRDSLNNIENNVVSPSKGVKIPAQQKQKLLQTSKVAQRLMSVLRAYLGGSLSTDLHAFLANLKYSILNSFSIDGNPLALATQMSAAAQLKSRAENLMMQVLSIFVPPDILSMLQSQGFGTSPNLYTILSQLVNQYAPKGYENFFRDLVLTLNSIVNYISDSNQYLSDQAVANASANLSISGGNMLSNTNSGNSEDVNNVVNQLTDNMKGLDIPVPVITLTEAQSSLNTAQLTDYIADKTIENLDNLGYLNGIDINNFKDILLGNVLLDSNTIAHVNSNIENVMYIRHWGSFRDISNLTDFYVRKSYKDKFKTANCIKTIDARGGKHIFIAIPSIKQNLKFYINSKEVEMEQTIIDLNYFDTYGNKVMYTIYYNDSLYNSNSVLIEVRQV